MSTPDFRGRRPAIHPHTFIAAGARIIGAVTLAEGVSIWPNCVLRADIEDIVVGEDTNIQDLSVVHVEHALPARIGRRVTVGHRAVIHACTVEDDCLIGMGAILLDGSFIGKNSLVAAGSVVPPGKRYPEGTLIMGIPAVVKRALTPEEIERNVRSAAQYREYWEAYVTKGIPSFEPER
jgi:carbonic anhydrase/acetyltransferase-like protein (isoleucine patch superfamily)